MHRIFLVIKSSKRTYFVLFWSFIRAYLKFPRIFWFFSTKITDFNPLCLPVIGNLMPLGFCVDKDQKIHVWSGRKSWLVLYEEAFFSQNKGEHDFADMTNNTNKTGPTFLCDLSLWKLAKSSKQWVVWHGKKMKFFVLFPRTNGIRFMPLHALEISFGLYPKNIE